MLDMIEIVLNQCTASYNVPSEISSVVSAPKQAPTINLSKKALKKNSAKASEPSPSNQTKSLTGMLLPDAGTIDAKTFMVQMRRAVNRDECIVAIAAYLGFDPKGEYGAQEYRAKMHAKKELMPHLFRSSNAVKQPTQAFVAGTPDFQSKKLSDLRGRLLMAETTRTEQLQLAHEALSDENRQYHITLASVETQRAQQIRDDLRKMEL